MCEVNSITANKSNESKLQIKVTHIVGGWSDSSTKGWKAGFGGGGAITVCPNFDFWGIYGTYTLT